MSHSPHLLILIGGHFANAPRPQKEAAAAVASGFRVTVMGTWSDGALSEEDLTLAKSIGVEFVPLLDLNRRTAGSIVSRISARLASIAYRKVKITFPESYGITARHMLKAAVRLNPDLIMVHSEAGLWAGKQLLERGYKVGVDFEDWFSEDLPAEARKGRPVEELRKLEHHLLNHADLSLTTTVALSNALKTESGCRRAPLAIPNTFPIVIDRERTLEEEDSSEPVKFYWFSQTIGPGRGLEQLATALEEVEGAWELHLRGNLRHYHSWFEKTFQHVPQQRVVIHGTVANEKLSEASADFHVGLALEDPQVRNRDLTATNKIFEYLRSRLAVIATDTRGQREVMAQCQDAGLVIPSNDPMALAGAVQFYIDDRQALTKARTRAFEAASTAWAWSRFSPQLGTSLEAACQSR